MHQHKSGQERISTNSSRARHNAGQLILRLLNRSEFNTHATQPKCNKNSEVFNHTIYLLAKTLTNP